MEFDTNVNHLQDAFWQIILAAGPILGVALSIGLLIGGVAGGSTAFTGGDAVIAGAIAGVIYCPIIAFKVLNGKNR